MGNKIDSREKEIREIFQLEKFSQKDKKQDDIYGEMMLLQ